MTTIQEILDVNSDHTLNKIEKLNGKLLKDTIDAFIGFVRSIDDDALYEMLYDMHHLANMELNGFDDSVILYASKVGYTGEAVTIVVEKGGVLAENKWGDAYVDRAGIWRRMHKAAKRVEEVL